MEAVGHHGSVTVVVRVRAANAREAELNFAPVVKIVDDNVIVFDPKTVSSPEFYHGRKRHFRDLNKRINRNVYFAFDRVFNESASNVEVFQSTAQSVVDDVLDGFNACVFAYGATGAGKTFTMLGTAGNPGITFLSVMSLFAKIDSQHDKLYDISISYLEVYNEQIRDLLCPGGALALREDANGDAVVTGLTQHQPSSAGELLNMLEFGNKNRTQHPTDANAESSRSHAVFQVYVKQRDRIADTTTNFKVGKLSLIDLAGSERATVTTNRGARLREGANINRSLLALGNCINALADGKAKGYIPYRNSKLTRLLKDSLGGNCRTLMIAAISPSSLSYEDTYNTLKYANRAKEIKVELKQNNLQVENHLSQYPKMVHDLRQQVAELQAKLASFESGRVMESAHATDTSSEQSSRLTDTLQKIFDDRVNIRKELMELDGSQKVLALKIHKKQLILGRLKLLVDDTEHTKTIGELQRSVNAAQVRMKKIVSRRTELEQKMKENNMQLNHIELDMNQQNEGSSVLLLQRCRHLEVELRDSQQHIKYLKKISRIQHRESVANEKLIRTLLQSSRHNFFVLKGHGLTTDAMNAEFVNFQHLLRGNAEVAFQGVAENVAEDAATQWTDINFENLLQFPSLGYRVSPTCQSLSNIRHSDRSADDDTSSVISGGHISNDSIVSDVCNMTFTVSSDKQTRDEHCQQENGPSLTSPVQQPVCMGRLTFADVESPSLKPTKQPVAKSPLLAVENSKCDVGCSLSTSDVSKRSILKPLNCKQFASNDSRSAADPLSEVLRTCNAMAKIGQSRQAPGYMQMTRSAAYRSQHAASQSRYSESRNGQQSCFGRVPVSTSHAKPMRIHSNSSVRVAPYPAHYRHGLLV